MFNFENLKKYNNFIRVFYSLYIKMKNLIQQNRYILKILLVL